MIWWLRGVGTSVSLVLDSRGHWKVFGRPAGVAEFSFQPIASSTPELHARFRTARCAWQVSDALLDCPVAAAHRAAIEDRSRRASDRSHGVTCLLESPGQPDLLSFTLVVPPSQFHGLLEQFRLTVGRADVHYSIFTPDAAKLDVEPEDHPSAVDFASGRPHFTGGVEFSFA